RPAGGRATPHRAAPDAPGPGQETPPGARAMRRAVRLVALMAGLMGGAIGAQPGHIDSWTDRYQSFEGVRCCNMECQPPDVTLASSARGEVWVNGAFLVLPPGSIHPMPSDATVPLAVSGYLCWRAKPLWPEPESVRCVWYRSGAW